MAPGTAARRCRHAPSPRHPARAGRDALRSALAQQVRPRQARPALVRREERAHLVLGRSRARIAGRDPPDDPQVAQVPSRQLVVAALAVEGQRLDRPAADAGDGAQAAPAALVVGSERSARPRRPRGRRAAGRSPARRSGPATAAGPARCRPASRRRAGRAGRWSRSAGRGGRRSAAGSAAARSNSMSCSQMAHASASKGSGRRIDAQMRPRAHRAPDHGIGAEALVEGAQVVVDAEREAHAPQGLLGHVGAVGAGHEQHAIARGLADADDRRRPLDVQQALEAAVAPAAQDPVGARAGQAVGPRRTHLSPHLDHRRDSTPRARRGRPRSAAGAERRGEAHQRQPRVAQAVLSQADFAAWLSARERSALVLSA